MNPYKCSTKKKSGMMGYNDNLHKLSNRVEGEARLPTLSISPVNMSNKRLGIVMHTICIYEGC